MQGVDLGDLPSVRTEAVAAAVDRVAQFPAAGRGVGQRVPLAARTGDPVLRGAAPVVGDGGRVERGAVVREQVRLRLQVLEVLAEDLAHA